MPNEKRFYPLNQQERTILRLFAEGYNNKEIANELCISQYNVREVRASLMKKLSARSISSGVRSALEEGVITLYDVLESRFSKRPPEARLGRS
jgi:DNA-binding NarL/FixJ family response regulator